LFVKILEEARRKYRFVVHGYVVMPEHFHLLITEPEVGDPSVVMKVIKERFARRVNRKRKQGAPGFAPAFGALTWALAILTEPVFVTKIPYPHHRLPIHPLK
jgi:REP element-mobilizing transposase RayT